MEKEKELLEKEAALKARELEFVEREKKLKKTEQNARHLVHVAFADGLVKEGKMLAASKDHAVALLDFAAGVEDGVVEFGEKKASAVQSLQDYFAGQPKIIEFAEVARTDTDPGKGGAADKLLELTKKKMAENKDLTYSAAFAEVQLDNPDLTAEYISGM